MFLWIASHLVNKLGRAAIVLPIAWVGIEFFRGSILWGGYPWYLISHPLIDSPLGILAMPASVGGTYFVSFLCAAYCSLLLCAISARSSKERLLAGSKAGGLFTLWITVGYILIPSTPTDGQTIRVAIIQPDIPQDSHLDWTVRQRLRDWYTLRDITQSAIDDPQNPGEIDLIIWPEGFVPGWTLDPLSLETERAAQLGWSMAPRNEEDVPDLPTTPSQIRATQIVDDLLAYQGFIDIPMLVGSVAFDNLQIVDTEDGIEYQRDAMYNSAFILANGRPQPVWYDKSHLTPFGEVMPYISKWERLEQSLLAFGANGMEFVLDPAKELRTLTVPVNVDTGTTSFAIATPICFEATTPNVCRKLVFDDGKRRARVMVNITNDGWFGSSAAGRISHLQNARWRCIELNTPMVRSANTGISAVINHRGRVLDRALVPLISESQPFNSNQGHIISNVTLAQGFTIYSKIGDIFGWACFAWMCFWSLRLIFLRSFSVQPVDTHAEKE